MNPNDKIAAFDPNGMGDTSGNIYGLPFNTNDARLIILPVPWEVTVSYQAGTALAPEAILEASYQVDLYDPFVADAWKLGIFMNEISNDVKEKSQILRLKAEKYIHKLSQGIQVEENAELLASRNEINLASHELVNHWRS